MTVIKQGAAKVRPANVEQDFTKPTGKNPAPTELDLNRLTRHLLEQANSKVFYWKGYQDGVLAIREQLEQAALGVNQNGSDAGHK